PSDDAVSRRSPSFWVGYVSNGRAYRTELYANPRVASFDVGPDDPTARSHEGAGFDVPLAQLLQQGGLSDLRGEPPEVIATLTAQLREWISARVDPSWKRHAGLPETGAPLTARRAKRRPRGG